MRAARIALPAIALIMAAWFALGARQADEVNAATSILAQSPVSAIDASRANALLSSATFLNPDRSVLLMRAEVALARGNDAEARQLIAQVYDAEPDNIEAWPLLVRAANGNHRLTFLAFEELGRLDPLLKLPTR